jgi:lipopolysaccharide/colanic/teichoic acid biosynthesis glycosyltransferase
MTDATALPADRTHGRADTQMPRWKRALDLGLTLSGLAAIWPLLLVLALAVRLTSPGPALFVQTRVGRHGVPFRMVKFRSMYRDAEARRAALLARSDREGLCFKMADDPRITPLGRLLRRSSLDELPQLWNVLRGEMSLVGPRPALPEEVAAYPPRARGRLAAVPGLTGPWQVAGRADIGFDAMVELDLAYACGPTLRGDLAILWRTLGAVTGGRGAC